MRRIELPRNNQRARENAFRGLRMGSQNNRALNSVRANPNLLRQILQHVKANSRYVNVPTPNAVETSLRRAQEANLRAREANRRAREAMREARMREQRAREAVLQNVRAFRRNKRSLNDLKNQIMKFYRVELTQRTPRLLRGIKAYRDRVFRKFKNAVTRGYEFNNKARFNANLNRARANFDRT